MNKLLVLNGGYFAGHDTDLNVLLFESDRSKAKPLSKEALGIVLRVVMCWIADDEIELKRLEVLTIKGEGQH